MSTYNQNNNKITSDKPDSNNNIRLQLYSTYWSVFEGGSAVNAPKIIEDLQVSNEFLIKKGDEIKRVIKSVYISSN